MVKIAALLTAEIISKLTNFQPLGRFLGCSFSFLIQISYIEPKETFCYLCSRNKFHNPIAMNSVEALEWRYAVKKFDDTKILSKEKIAVLKKSFQLTPSSSGLQPNRLVIIQDKELQKKLEKHSYYQKQVATASHLLVFCIETEVDASFIHNKFELEKEIRNTPDEILHPFREGLIANFSEKDTTEKHIWAVNQVYLAMGNLLNICAIERIDACPMEGFDTEKYDELLKLEEKGLKSVLAMPIGVRSKDDIFAGFKKVRRPMKDVIIEL